MILNNWAIDARIVYFFLVTMGMAKILKVENKMLDNFEEELEDVGYFDSLE
jgi:hypothetical protein